MDSNKTEPQEAACFMCQQAGRDGCLECRTHRLIADIKHSLYERLGAEQNQSEWEERATAAEAALSQAQERIKALTERCESVSEYHCPRCGLWWFRTPNPSRLGPEGIVECKGCGKRFPRKEWAYAELRATPTPPESHDHDCAKALNGRHDCSCSTPPESEARP